MSARDLTSYPALDSFVDELLGVWPEHDKALKKSLYRSDDSELTHAESIAILIDRLTSGRKVEICTDYRWVCERLLEEELHFHRNDSYRNSTFADAEREVYANHEFMRQYVNGLLLSHLFWSNHRRVLNHYLDRFLPNNPNGFRHLEVGPGHGLYLYFAARDPQCTSAEGWDLSATSVQHTLACLKCLGVEDKAGVYQQSVLGPMAGDKAFDSIVISEVLEHLENPGQALHNLKSLISDRGRVFVNMPINSPAPDHIFLLRDPQEVSDLVEASGFKVVEAANYPAMGSSLERALKNRTTVSCVVIAKPG